MPESVNAVGNNAFNGCKNLKNVTIKGNISKLSLGMFFGCGSLESITVPDGVTRVEEGAFGNCSSLKSITFPASIRYIEYGAYEGCSSLVEIVYGGTRAQWKRVKKMDTKFIPLKCTDDVPDSAGEGGDTAAN